MARIDPGSGDNDPDLPFDQADDGDPRLVRPYIAPKAATPSDATGAEIDENPETAESPLVPSKRLPGLFFLSRDDSADAASGSAGQPAAGELDGDAKPLYGRSPDSDWLRRRRRRQLAAAALPGGEPSAASPGVEPSAAPPGGEPPVARPGGAEWDAMRAAVSGMLVGVWPRGHRRQGRLLLIIAGAVAAFLLIVFVSAVVMHDKATPSAGRLPDALPPALFPSSVSAEPTGARALPPPLPGAGGPAVSGTAPGNGTAEPGGRAPTSTRTTVPPPVATPKPPTTPATHVGAIRGIGGRCLDVIGGVEAKGHRLQVLTCDGAVGQTWSLTPGGTLTAGGKCAQSTGSEAVKLVGCDGAAAGVWRVGPGSSLVNTSTGDCLTDPSAGTGNAIEVRLLACDGGAGQWWSLP